MIYLQAQPGFSKISSTVEAMVKDALGSNYSGTNHEDNLITVPIEKLIKFLSALESSPSSMDQVSSGERKVSSTLGSDIEAVMKRPSVVKLGKIYSQLITPSDKENVGGIGLLLEAPVRLVRANFVGSEFHDSMFTLEKLTDFERESLESSFSLLRFLFNDFQSMVLQNKLSKQEFSTLMNTLILALDSSEISKQNGLRAEMVKEAKTCQVKISDVAYLLALTGMSKEEIVNLLKEY